jgi:hypothetical protein
MANIPLTYDDRAAVADVPTPGGPTRRQIGVPATATLLPIVEVTDRPAEIQAGVAETTAVIDCRARVPTRSVMIFVRSRAVWRIQAP